MLTHQEGKLTGAHERENKVIQNQFDSAVSPLDSVARETLFQQLKGKLVRVPGSDRLDVLKS